MHQFCYAENTVPHSLHSRSVIRNVPANMENLAVQDQRPNIPRNVQVPTVYLICDAT